LKFLLTCKEQVNYRNKRSPGPPGKDLLVAAGEQEDIRNFFLFSKVNVSQVPKSACVTAGMVRPQAALSRVSDEHSFEFPPVCLACCYQEV
jgi:hypothetical protein